jgi:hypothetical protein
MRYSVLGFTLQSREGQIAAPSSVILLLLSAIVSIVIPNPTIVNGINTVVSILLGCGVGWVMGEAFLYAQGFQKWLLV